jgi:diguanylate cyclase (GGDEF)-like protein
MSKNNRRAIAPPLPVTLDELYEFVRANKHLSDEDLRDAFKSVKRQVYSLLGDRNAAITQIIQGQSERQQEVEDKLREAELKARLDPTGLTSFYTRQAATSILSGVLTERRCPNLSLLYIDIHRFKEYNDIPEQKHEVGDLVITKVSEILARAVRDAYMVRWGGDEFIFITSNIIADDLSTLARRVQVAVEDYPKWPLEHPFFLFHPPRVDIGAVYFNSGTLRERENYGIQEVIKFLIKCGDQNMFRSKEDHKNNIKRVYCSTVLFEEGRLVQK